MVDSNDGVTTGNLWVFYTQLSIPEIVTQPEPYLLVDASTTASFSVTVDSVSAESYQWYKDGVIIGGAQGATFEISNAQIGDEGIYHCEISNDATIPVGSEPVTVSDSTLLGIKRKIAHWDFESGNTDSIVVDSPTSTLVGDPVFVIAGGVSGDAMDFDADTDAGDMLHTDLAETAYFDICNFNMTVGCWIKSTISLDWAPMVARNGEENGWQLRQGNVGAEGDDVTGIISSSPDYDIPVTIAGRIGDDGDAGAAIIDDQVTAGTYDEVKIYNYARSAAQIAQEYATVTGTAICSSAPTYDLDGDCIVGLGDLSLLASEWLSGGHLNFILDLITIPFIPIIVAFLVLNLKSFAYLAIKV